MPAGEVEAYLQRLIAERGCSPHTADAYRRDLALLATIAGEGGWPALDEAALRRWVAGAARAGAAPKSIARRLSAWRGFLDAIVQRGLIASNPARGPSPARSKTPSSKKPR